MTANKREINASLPVRDRQLLETIGYTALHKTRKTVISRDKTKLIKAILK
jgi:hypothetical protein